jgi:LysM repeat protein
MKTNKLFITVRCVFLLSAVAAGAESITYIVKKGDTLSEIAHKNIPGPIYGRNGSLDKILSFNPQIKNPNKIYVGAVINLDTPSLRSVAEEHPPEGPARIELLPEVPEKKTYGEFSVRAGMEFFRLNSTDNTTGANATVLSNMNPTVALNWKQHWSDAWATNFRLNYESVNLQNPSPRTMTSSNVGAYGFGVGVERSFSDSFTLIGSLGYDQEFFLESASTQTLTLDTIAIPSASLAARFDFYKRNLTNVGLEATYSYLSTGSNSLYAVSTGSAYSGMLYWHQELSSSKTVLTGEVFYRQQSQNTSLVTQTQTDVGGVLGLTWVFGK